ncbi:unnamed protein product [Phytophthora fragariaefolia]|uniref:NADPH--hemoprotein reductase n=1 Tax=Phytophthora fragariaefolia TaxID=1490495 RepID=A0A9W7CJ74_9STRA|nr:unnamed protein product [Phytophthora fragariaefolia]
MVSYQPNPPGIPVRKPKDPSYRASLPCVSSNSESCTARKLDDQAVTRGPTTADLKIYIGLAEQERHKLQQRRYSSATTMILSRRAGFKFAKDSNNSLGAITTDEAERAESGCVYQQPFDDCRMSLLSSDTPICCAPRPPLRQTGRISFSFRKSTQAARSITHLDIYTGSLTGTSERFASMLAEDAAKYGAIVSLKSLEEFNPECFSDANGPYHSKSRLTVFVVSTHFAGGPSPNAEIFSQWLRLISGDSMSPTIDPVIPDKPQPTEVVKEVGTATPIVDGTNNLKPRRSMEMVAPITAPRPLRQASFSAAIRPILLLNWKQPFRGRNSSTNTSKPKNIVHGAQYAVFGVGNSMYLTYNAMGKFVDARLHALGAIRSCPLGLGDVTNDIDDSFAKWKAQILRLLVYQNLGPPANVVVQAQGSYAATRRTYIAENSTRQLPLQRTLSDPSSIEPKSSQSSQPEVVQVSSLFRRPSGVRGPPTPQSSVVGGTTKFSVLDHYGRSVRLRFRCRYITSENMEQPKSPRRTKLPPIVTGSEAKLPVKLSRTLSSVKRDARHIRHPCIAVRSVITIKDAGIPGEGPVNASASKEVLLARLCVLDPELKFETADTFGYFPPNAKDVVDEICSKLGFDMEAYVEFTFEAEAEVSSESSSSSTSDTVQNHDRGRHFPFPNPSTIRTILRDFLELRTISREFLRIASGFVREQKEHDLLENMASIDGSAVFNLEFAQAKSGVLKLLELAPSLQMPFEVFVNLIPLLKPRLYSVASSHLKNDREFDIVVALGNPHEVHGLSVSNFRQILSQSSNQIQFPNKTNCLQADAEPNSFLMLLRGFVAYSRFKSPSDISAPMIMIANGIGIAPFRALLQQRELESEHCRGKQNSPEQVAPGGSEGQPLSTKRNCRKSLLFLGCSNKSSFLFETEFRAWESQGIVEIHVAYSSEPGHTPQHVQDLVFAQKEQIAALMSSSQEARIFICGKIAMAQAVHQILSTPDTTSSHSWYREAFLSGRYIEGIFG